MIIVNLLLLKSANGMLYYANDYIHSIKDETLVLVRRPLLRLCRELFYESTVVEVGQFGFLAIWFRVLFSGAKLFTPTSHPLPFLSSQLVVVHDSYPFQGRVGRIKRALFHFSLITSCCKVAYINHSDSKRFVESCVSDVTRHVFLPNHFPAPSVTERSRHYRGGVLTVGLVGTDSAKKNYSTLFAAVVARGLSHQIRFLVFGHDTAYFKEVCCMHPQVQVRLVLSDSVSMDQFFCDVDCLTSVARNEGFGRPVAYAISSGVPCFLIEDEVFREFYDGLAMFAPTVDMLVSCVLMPQNHISQQLKSANFPPLAIRSAIKNGVETIQNL